MIKTDKCERCGNDLICKECYAIQYKSHSQTDKCENYMEEHCHCNNCLDYKSHSQTLSKDKDNVRASGEEKSIRKTDSTSSVPYTPLTKEQFTYSSSYALKKTLSALNGLRQADNRELTYLSCAIASSNMSEEVKEHLLLSIDRIYVNKKIWFDIDEAKKK